MKETIKEDSIQIPDYIEGIPTDRKMLEERFRLIQSYMTGIKRLKCTSNTASTKWRSV
jgi:hypothetical protein